MRTTGRAPLSQASASRRSTRPRSTSGTRRFRDVDDVDVRGKDLTARHAGRGTGSDDRRTAGQDGFDLAVDRDPIADARQRDGILYGGTFDGTAVDDALLTGGADDIARAAIDPDNPGREMVRWQVGGEARVPAECFEFDGHD